MPDTYMDAYDTFGVDHYKPKQGDYAGLINVYSNLYYCCKKCNDRKKGIWRRNDKQFVPNPCNHVMFDHLRYNKEKVETKSEAGKFTEELLQLNGPGRVASRTHMLLSLRLVEQELRKLMDIQSAARRKAKGIRGLWSRKRCLRDLNSIRHDLHTLRQSRNALHGLNSSVSR
jgi:hypothetical protein